MFAVCSTPESASGSAPRPPKPSAASSRHRWRGPSRWRPRRAAAGSGRCSSAVAAPGCPGGWPEMSKILKLYRILHMTYHMISYAYVHILCIYILCVCVKLCIIYIYIYILYTQIDHIDVCNVTERNGT